jgi:hypothetical protein
LITGVSYKKKKVPPKLPPRESFKKLIKKMADQVKYKEPTIVRTKRGWFIALYYEWPDRPGEFKRFEISCGVNYIHNLEEREKEIQILLRELKKAL